MTSGTQSCSFLAKIILESVSMEEYNWNYVLWHTLYIRFLGHIQYSCRSVTLPVLIIVAVLNICYSSPWTCTKHPVFMWAKQNYKSTHIWSHHSNVHRYYFHEEVLIQWQIKLRSAQISSHHCNVHEEVFKQGPHVFAGVDFLHLHLGVHVAVVQEVDVGRLHLHGGSNFCHSSFRWHISHIFSHIFLLYRTGEV